MLTQTLTSWTLESSSTEDDQSPQRSIQMFQRNLLNKMESIPAFRRIVQLQSRTRATSQSVGAGKSITNKMRTKLVSWLEKLSLETFQFSIDTLLLAIKILDEYLCLTNESSKTLQLIGCASLYLAAKAREVVIVAGQCYVVASASCFTEEQLMEKEMQVYRALGYNTTFSSLYRVYKYIQNQSGQTDSYYNKQQVEMRLLEIAKNIDFRQWQEHRIISMLVAISETKKKVPSIVELMEMLRLCSA